MDDPRWLTPDELEAWRYLSAVLLLLPARFDEPLREEDLTFFDYSILAALSSAHERTKPMSELSILTQGSLSRLSHAAKRLEKRGWLRRGPSPDDGRVTLATLTDVGYEHLVRIAPKHVESVQCAVFDAIAPDQVSQMRDICRAIMEGVIGTEVRPPWVRTDEPS